MPGEQGDDNPEIEPKLPHPSPSSHEQAARGKPEPPQGEPDQGKHQPASASRDASRDMTESTTHRSAGNHSAAPEGEKAGSSPAIGGAGQPGEASVPGGASVGRQPAFDSFLFEVALLLAQRYTALLPRSHVPVAWLRELVLSSLPALAAQTQTWDIVVSHLLRTGRLRKEGSRWPEVYVAGRATQEMLSGMKEDDILYLKRRLQAFCSTRLEAHRAEERRRRNLIMTGDPNTSATAWTVPSLEVVLARSAGDESVRIVDHDDGSYSIVLSPSPAWEMDALTELAIQEFAGNDLEGITWALRSGLLTVNQLAQEEQRIGQGHERTPYNEQAALVAGLYWLTLAHRRYGSGGSCRGSWRLCQKAVEILQPLHEHNPNDPHMAEILDEARKAMWAYDD